MELQHLTLTNDHLALKDEIVPLFAEIAASLSTLRFTNIATKHDASPVPPPAVCSR
jgi:hypothetical protein